MNKKSYSEEIDLFSLIKFLWVNKLKIFLSAVIAVFVTLYFETYKKKEIDTYSASTSIFPITNLEASRYNYYNNLTLSYSFQSDKNEDLAQSTKSDFDLNVFIITRKLLLDMFKEKVGDRDLLKKAIKKYELVEKENYDTEESYNEAVLRFASSIKIEEKDNLLLKQGLSLVASVNDKKKWESVLFYLNENVNEFVRDYIRIYFNNAILEMIQHFTYILEDVETEIVNTKKNYNRTTRDRLAFLNEQKAIARHLNVAKNTITAQTFITDTGVVANLQTEMPYYMRGYEMIEKEIELILNRSDKEAFMPVLISLEKKKRAILQSIQNLKRNEFAFEKTPVFDLDNFYAGNLDIRTTIFIRQNTTKSLSVKLMLAVLIGGILGVFFSVIWVNRKKFK